MEHTDLEQWLIPAPLKPDDGALLLEDVFGFPNETCSIVATDPTAPHLLLGSCEASMQATPTTPFMLMDSSSQHHRPVLQLQPIQSGADATGCSTWIAREAAQRRGLMPTIAVPPAPSSIAARCNALVPFRAADVGRTALPAARAVEPKEPPAPKQYVHPQPPMAKPSWAGPVTASAGVQVALPQSQPSSARVQTAVSPTAAAAVGALVPLPTTGSPASDNTECTPTLLLGSYPVTTPKLPESTDKQFDHFMRELEMSPGDPDICTLSSRSSMLTSTSGSENSSADVLFMPQAGGAQLVCNTSQPTPCMLQPTPHSASGTPSSSCLDRFQRMASVNGPPSLYKHQNFVADSFHYPQQAQHPQHMQHVQQPTMVLQHSTQSVSTMGSAMRAPTPSPAPITTDLHVLAPPLPPAPPPPPVMDANSPTKKRPASRPAPTPSLKRAPMKLESVASPTGIAAPVRPRKSAKRHSCWNCGVHSTPQWRCGPDGPRTLCNACGVRYKKGLPLKAYPYKDANGLATRVPPPPAPVQPAPAAPAAVHEEPAFQAQAQPQAHGRLMGEIMPLPVPVPPALPTFCDSSLYGMFDFAAL